MRVAIATDPAEPSPDIQEERDQEQDRRSDQDDLESAMAYFVAGRVPMNGIAAPGVRYCGSWPFHLLIA